MVGIVGVVVCLYILRSSEGKTYRYQSMHVDSRTPSQQNGGNIQSLLSDLEDIGVRYTSYLRLKIDPVVVQKTARSTRAK
mgnify:CR=1 FL=1